VTVCLAIIQNHQYVRNIRELNRIYKDRFDHIVHIVPFYQGTDENVIAVFENSHYFEGFIAQATSSVLSKLDHDHYIFIADDLILNPCVTQNNYREYFSLFSLDTCFLPGFQPFSTLDHQWPRSNESLAWRIDKPGVEVSNFLPSVNEARRKFRALNISFDPVSRRGLWARWPKVGRGVFSGQGLWNHLRQLKIMVQTNAASMRHIVGRRTLRYPLVGGYSDLVVVSKDVLSDFSQLCGVFAATELFVEIAIPTALALSAQNISTEKNSPLKGNAMWSVEEVDTFFSQHNGNIDYLLTHFPASQLYVHPIKLSRWTKESPV
jgi:hypothetical protein